MTTSTQIEKPVEYDHEGKIVWRQLCSVIGCNHTASAKVVDAELGIMDEQFCPKHVRAAERDLGKFVSKRCIY